MRPDPNNAFGAMSASREINARATFINERLRFANVPASEPGLDDPLIFYDAATYNNGILRVCATLNSLCVQWVPDPSLPIWPDWVDKGIFTTYAKLAVFGNRIFYQAPNNALHYTDFDTATGALGAPQNFGVSLAPYQVDDVSFAPVSATEVYLLTKQGTSGAGKVVYCLVNGSTLLEWNGRIYDGDLNLGIFDAERIGGVDYVYFSDKAGLRATYLTRVGDNWSEIKHVIPMDLVDDTCNFKLAATAVLNGRVFATGILNRKDGRAMHIYTIGPEQFTLGRDMFVRSELTAGTLGGKLHLVGANLYYVGPQIRFVAPATRLVGYTANPANSLVTQEIETISLQSTASVPSALTVDLKSDLAHAALKAGNEMELEVAYNGSYIKLGTFGIDGIVRPTEQSSKGLTISARSSAVKRLAQWESDACYDYWSQTKVATNPKELSEVVRVTGQWSESDGALTLDDLNLDGVLYTAEKASRNGTIRSNFYKVPGDFTARYGVGMNYYRGSVTVTEDGEDKTYLTNNGIFAIYGATEFSGASGVGIYRVENDGAPDGAWTKLTSFPLAISDGVWYAIELMVQEGRCRVWTRNETTGANWALGKDFTITDKSPWTHEDLGRGAVFVRNITPHAAGYAFLSTDTVIPVQDNSGLPAPGGGGEVVRVESEIIKYLNKSPNINIGPLSYAYGDKNAAYETIGGAWQTFANVRNTNYVRQTFTLPGDIYVSAVKVYAKKVGYPEDGLDIAVYGGSINDDNPLGTEIVSVEVPSEKISATGDWLVARFRSKVLVKNGNWIILTRGTDPNRPNASNCYAVPIGGDYAGGVFQTFNDNNDTFDTKVGDTPFILYGSTLDQIGRYAINFSGAAGVLALLSHADDAYNNQALVVTDGAGKNSCFRIVGYKYQASTCIVYVDRDPGTTLDETSILSIVPTLYGLTRGQSGTLASAHSATQVDVFRAAPYVTSSNLEYYSTDIDLTFEDLARELCRKAGVLNVVGEKLMSGTLTLGTPSPVFRRRNFIVRFFLPSFGVADNLIIAGRSKNADASAPTIDLTITNTAISLQGLSYPLAAPLSGWITVSYFDDHVSIWANGALVQSFHYAPADPSMYGDYMQIRGAGGKVVTVDYPECCVRIDNFILDMGVKGNALLDQLVGEKRIFYQDAADGSLYIYRNHYPVNTAITPYPLAVTEGDVETDTNLITRLRLEGAEVCEDFDDEFMIERGNLFHMANMNEINTVADAQEFNALLLDDTGSRIVSKALFGAADPRIEPNDMLYATVSPGVSYRVIVDQVDFNLQLNEQDAILDMNIQGRIPRSDL